MRVGVVVVLSCLAVCVAAAPAVAGKGGKKGKPDLVVKEGALTGQPFGFSQEVNTISFSDWTKNVGKAKAGESVTALHLIRPTGVELEAGSRDIAKLKDGKSSNGSSETMYTLEPPLGAHTLEVCADADDEVEEKNERNNCLALPGNFFVIERIWSGSVSGTACLVPGVQGGCSDVKETWESNNATFTFDQYLGEGVFNYVYRGVVFYLDQGEEDNCTWSSGGGANASPFEAGSLVMDYLNNEYNASAYAPSFYTITEDCSGTSRDFEHRGPWFEYFLQTSARSGLPMGSGQPLPFGHAFLQGSFTGTGIGNGGDLPVTWTWDLQ